MGSTLTLTASLCCFSCLTFPFSASRSVLSWFTSSLVFRAFWCSSSLFSMNFFMFVLFSRVCSFSLSIWRLMFDIWLGLCFSVKSWPSDLEVIYYDVTLEFIFVAFCDSVNPIVCCFCCYNFKYVLAPCLG